METRYSRFQPTPSNCPAIRSMFIALSVLASVMIASSTWAGKKPSGQFRWFKSKSGGYELRILSSWQVTERLENGHYEATFTAVGTEESPDHSQPELSIVRVKNYMSLHEFSSTAPRDVAADYAHRTSPIVGQDGDTTFVGPIDTLHGMQTFTFKAVSVATNQECRSLTIVVGVKGEQLFCARWELPCADVKPIEFKEPPANDKDREIQEALEGFYIPPSFDDPIESKVLKMVGSLTIRRKWGTGDQ